MTERLYYNDSFLYEFDANVIDIKPASSEEPRPAVVLDRTAFYPTSGGQLFDTGWIALANSPKEKTASAVVEVREKEDGTILHFLDSTASIECGSRVHGMIEEERRHDHIQQHSGQHVLSATFVRLFDIPTLSFHMGDDSCSIDLDSYSLGREQIEAAEHLANEAILQNRSVDVRFVTQEEASLLGLRKVPRADTQMLRLIDIHDFDLCACGGTHVRATGQIGSILLRKTDKVRQGMRVEFVCGQRAVKTARRDYTTLVEAAGSYSSHIWDVPEQIRKAQEEARASRRSRDQLLEELVGEHARRILAETQSANNRKVLLQVFQDRDFPYVKLLAQNLTRLEPNVIALVGTTSGESTLIFAQSRGQPFDMGALMKEALAQLGGRGGGSKDMAQGGPQQIERIESVLRGLSEKLH